MGFSLKRVPCEPCEPYKFKLLERALYLLLVSECQSLVTFPP